VHIPGLRFYGNRVVVDENLNRLGILGAAR
jgi:hypothetical protein